MLRHIKFVNLAVTDQQRAMDFYTGVLGFSVQQDNAFGAGQRFVELGLAHATTTLVLTPHPEVARGTVPALYLVDDDVRGSAETYRARGAEIVAEPQSAPWDPHTVWCWLRDTEGNIVMIQNGPEEGS